VSSFTYDLSGRIALVTGASSGLGAHFARRLAAAGASVVVAARRVELLDQLCAEISAADGRAAAVELDVADEASTQAAYDAAERQFGPVDVVVANAGLSADRPALELPIDAFDRVISVNLRGAFLTAREGARRMIASGSSERGNGRIILISSVTTRSASPGLAAYSSSKAAVTQLARVFAREWARSGINVNSLSPGYIETDMNQAWFASDEGQKQLKRFPRRRLATMADLDGMLLFLASDASRAVTGADFVIDDGQML
jgi:NAD(P)-dependent dehydrogenase (short-subunit alcohol dehydrogenase family)